VIVGDATIPVSAERGTGNVVHGIEPEGNRATRQQRQLQVLGRQRDGPGPIVAHVQRQRIARIGEDHPLQPGAHRLPADRVRRECAQVADRRAQARQRAALAPQQAAAATGEHVQATAPASRARRSVRSAWQRRPRSHGVAAAPCRAHARRSDGCSRGPSARTQLRRHPRGRPSPCARHRSRRPAGAPRGWCRPTTSRTGSGRAG